MAAATDKARFYLEKYVPELQEYERKGIFTRDEIQAIAAKRSDFEHILNARGSTPGDYVRYATYEMNLDSLRKKRCKRLSVKNATSFNGQRTIFFIMDRATKKFPGDVGLWKQYISYCQKQKAAQKLAKVFTAALRLRPTDWGLWVLAAKHYSETQGDIDAARSHLQRGLRFCEKEPKMYLEYAKLEMVYLAKLAARRKILGLDQVAVDQQSGGAGDFSSGDDMVALPKITADDLAGGEDSDADSIEGDVHANLTDAPAFTGALPLAIFDSAMQRFENNPELALSFFDIVVSFSHLKCTPTILRHIVDQVLAQKPTAPASIICRAKLQLSNTALESAEFPIALGKGLATVKSGLAVTSDLTSLSEKAIHMLLPYASQAGQLDNGIVKVIDASLKRYVRLVSEAPATGGLRSGRSRIRKITETLNENGQGAQAQLVVGLAGLTSD